MRSAFTRFAVRLHTVAKVLQQGPDGALADLVPLCLQFLGQFGRALAGPAKRRFRITTSDRINQLVKGSHQIWIACRQSFAAAAGTPNAPCSLRSDSRRATRLRELTQASVDSSAREATGLRDKRRSSPAKHHGIRSGTKPRRYFVQAGAQEFIFALKHGKFIHTATIQAPIIDARRNCSGYFF